MKVANLWLFFGTASAAAVEEDSREYFRWHAEAQLAEPLRLVASAGQATASGDVEIRPAGLKLGVARPRVDGSSSDSITVRIAPLVLRTPVGRVGAQSSAIAVASPARVASNVSPAVGAGSTNGVVINGTFPRARVRAGAYVDIGPDLIEEELEEILLLLEVA